MAEKYINVLLAMNIPRAITVDEICQATKVDEELQQLLIQIGNKHGHTTKKL